MITFTTTLPHSLQNARIATMQLGQLFPVEDGPCVLGLEEALAEIGVDRQAYYSGTFVGNHVHKCCQVSSAQNVYL